MRVCNLYANRQGEIVKVQLAGDNNMIPVDAVELMQSTGLLDKNGKEIWEGDIIVQEGYSWFDKGVPNYRDTVEWIYSQWQTVHHCVNPAKRGISDGINTGLNDDGVDEGERTDWEVLGNRYENPELLARPEL